MVLNSTIEFSSVRSQTLSACSVTGAYDKTRAHSAISSDSSLRADSNSSCGRKHGQPRHVLEVHGEEVRRLLRLALLDGLVVVAFVVRR